MHAAGLHRSEPTSSGSAPAGRDVFLTPRVLDQAAFEELSGALKELMRDATAAGAALRSHLDSAERVRADVAESVGKHRATLELSAKLLKAMTARAEALEQMVGRLESGQQMLDRISLESERLVASRIGALEARVQSAVESLERATARGAEILRGSGQQGGLGSVVERAEAVRDGLDAMSVRMDRVHADAAGSTARLAESLGGSMKLLDGLEARGMTLVRTVETAMSRAERSAQDATDRAGVVRMLTEDLSAATERARVEREALGADVSRVERAAARVEQVLTEARHTMRDLERWRPILEGESISGGMLPEPLARIAEQFRREIGQDLGKMATAMAAVARRIEPSPVSARQTPEAEVVVRSSAR